MPNAKPADWLGLLALVIMFGSAFMFIKIAIQEFPPAVVASGRIIIAAIVLLAISLIKRESFVFVKDCWLLLIFLGIFGNCLPFYFISWGQLAVDSSIAGILMAIMPLTTIVLAHFFVPNEKLTSNKVVGFLLGFLGILVLLGPAAIAKLETGANAVIAMLAILTGAVCYAINSILAKRLPNESLLAISTVVLVFASILMLPILLLSDQSWEINYFSAGLISLLMLGIFPTALATIVYFAVIVRVGPSFMSQINYLIPIWAVLMGIVFLQEKIDYIAFMSLGIILLGIAIAQRRNFSIARF